MGRGSGRASEYLARKEAPGSYGTEAARRGEKKQCVRLEVRFGKIRVEQPAGRAKEEREKYPGEIEMREVQAKEEKGDGAAGGKKEINWTLYTGYEVETREDALKAIEYYKSRWLTENLFRTVKSEGMNYEVGELGRGAGEAVRDGVYGGAKEDLAWAAWIIGCLGGWKVYSVTRPPGVVTLREGMERFQNIFTGWLIARRCV
jgi:hypothetical protein